MNGRGANDSTASLRRYQIMNYAPDNALRFLRKISNLRHCSSTCCPDATEQLHIVEIRNGTLPAQPLQPAQPATVTMQEETNCRTDISVRPPMMTNRKSMARGGWDRAEGEPPVTSIAASLGARCARPQLPQSTATTIFWVRR